MGDGWGRWRWDEGKEGREKNERKGIEGMEMDIREDESGRERRREIEIVR